MPLKPSVSAQLMSQMGMARSGGIASRGSNSAMSSKGSGFAAMENALLKGPKPNPKKMAAGKPGRQFFTKSAGGDQSGLKKVKGAVSSSKGPVMSAQSSKQFGKFK